MKVVLFIFFLVYYSANSFAINDSIEVKKNHWVISYGALVAPKYSHKNYSNEIGYIGNAVNFFDEVSYLRRLKSKKKAKFYIGMGVQHSIGRVFTDLNKYYSIENIDGSLFSLSWYFQKAGINNYIQPYGILNMDLTISDKSFFTIGIKPGLPQVVISSEPKGKTIIAGEYLPSLNSTVAWYKKVNKVAIGLEVSINVLGNYIEASPFRFGTSIRI